MLCISRNKSTGKVEYRVQTKVDTTKKGIHEPILIPKVKTTCNVPFDVWYDKQQQHIDTMYDHIITQLASINWHSQDQYIEIKPTFYKEFAKYLYQTSNTSKHFFKLL